VTVPCFVQSFLRDAEQLESLTASDEAFLDFKDLGVSFCFSILHLLSSMFDLRLSIALWYDREHSPRVQWNADMHPAQSNAHNQSKQIKLNIKTVTLRWYYNHTTAG